MNPPLVLADPAAARSSNLAFALGTLPRERRDDALVFYGFCREVDDIADEPFRSPEERIGLLSRWIDALCGGEALPEALEDVMARNDLDPSLLAEIVRGVAMDVAPGTRFETFEELQKYSWRVASAVGLASARIFGCRHPDSERYAVHLGYALQFTNILRDVAEDARMGRVYIPAEDLAAFGVSPENLLDGTPDGEFENLMRFEASRARHEFAIARAYRRRDDARALVAAEVMREVYERVLTRMEADQFRVFDKRYAVPKWEKCWILLSAMCRPAGKKPAA